MDRWSFLLVGVTCFFAAASHAVANELSEVGSSVNSHQAILSLNSGIRWLRTATNGANLIQGDPTVLTWSIVPDGTAIIPRDTDESIALSDLISFLDKTYGDRPNWLPMFQGVFDRWAAVSGLSYVYEPSDDGQPIAPNEFAVGQLNVRGDIRISGHALDVGVLAYNYFPPNGDMIIDTSEMLRNSDRGDLEVRNLLAHEHGHGLGFQHIVSNDSNFLMEPFINTIFDGPQLDDIIVAQRAYGDAYEQDGGNDNVFSATDLGELSFGDSVSVGTDATSVQVRPDQVDFVSIDDDSDMDVYSFSVPGQTTASILLEPLGPTFSRGISPENQTLLDASSLSDLSLELLSPGGFGVLATSSSHGIGEPEQITSFSLREAGSYFVRVSGAQDTVQMYSLTISLDPRFSLPGDVNVDGRLDATDIDAFSTALRTDSIDSILMDLDQNGVVEVPDRTFLVESLLNTHIGDSNLDGEFNSTDLIFVFQADQYEDAISGNSGWSTGDWDGSGDFDSADFVFAFQAAGYETGPRVAAAVPEPSSCLLPWSGLSAMLLLLRRQRPF